MIKIEISQDQIKKAENLYPFDVLKNSITSGKSNIYGALGEIIIFDFFTQKELSIVFESTFDYDLIIESIKVDVKSKKFTNKFKPNKNWNLNISDFNTSQKCDYYFFVGIANDFKIAYLYGYITPEDFYNIAIFNKKDEIDPSGNGIWKFKSDCYNLEISKLKEFKC